MSQRTAAQTAEPRELYGIQMLRGAAALAVAVHHTLETSNSAAHPFSPDWLTTCGASGVDIFFVISGFIMLYVSFSRPAPLKPGVFLLKRVKRIYPFYWVCCLALLTAYLAAYCLGIMKHTPLTIYDFIASFVLLPSNLMILGVAWTLVYEMYFYLIFAATLNFKSRTAAVFGSTCTIIFIYLLASALSLKFAYTFFTNQVPMEFCMGLGLAWVYLWLSDRGKPWPRIFVFGFLAFGLLALAPFFVSHPNTNGLPQRVIPWGVPAAFIVAAGLTLGAPRTFIGRFTVLLGDASYALYLTHEIVLTGYGWLIKRTMIGRLDQVYIVPLIVCLSVIAGIAAHKLVELPLTGWSKTFWIPRLREKLAA